MKKIIPLSLIAVASLYSAEVTLDPISVETTMLTEVSKKAQVSADLSQALSASVPSIDMNRRSGIANDIYIRGQKRDNISVEVDGTKTCGACPNRMDPPVSHVLASQIENIEVIEGPYDVESFGTMSGGIKITTKAPTKEGHAEVNMGYGSFNYTKVGVTASGGNDIVRVLVSGTSESSDQYKDGNGDTMAQQVVNSAVANPTDAQAQGAQYKNEDMKAYSKKSIMAKAFITVAQNQELRLSATANRSDDILYPNSKMDALYDDSNIFSAQYNIDNLTDSYENLNIQVYKSTVDHPMVTDYRKSSMMMGNIKSWLTTEMLGLKVKNSLNIAGHELLVGVDGSQRKWNGSYYKNENLMMNPATGDGKKSIDDSKTTNMAIFTKLKKSFGDLDVAIGARVDSTEITNGGTHQDNDYTGINANIVTTYNLDKESKVFLGFGQATRVPDARELYFTSSMGKHVGTDTLDQTTNQELDLGYEMHNDIASVKVKAFYSMLSDYIYIQKGVAVNAFQNIDATVYGAEFSSSIYATDDITLDMGISYKVGEKDEALAGQTNTNLADIAPLRGNLALSYEYANDSLASLELQASDKWSDFDSDNGEQALDSWSVVNLKVKHSVSKSFDFTLGVNNLLNETYSVSNTYADLTLLTAGTGNVMLLNETGRYVYTNLSFKF